MSRRCPERGGRPIDQQDYRGFYAPVASRVRRLDACFGAFIADLKARSLYDESLIVVTSDHGDSLGEEGRMGHAFTLYPEIVRIPLLMHLPASLRNRWSSDVARPAYSTDLTPTIYRLLGHEPVAPEPYFGEPLVFAPGQAPPPPRDRMVAASYGSVYGAVLKGGRELYVVDAMQLREMAFVMGREAQPGRQVTPDASQRATASAIILETVRSLARLHGYVPR